MWTQLAHIILKFRLPLLIILVILTAFFGYQARKVEWSFDLAKTVPDTDPDMVYFQEFKKLFGEDGNMLAIGVKDSAIYKVENFQKFRYLADELARINNITNVLSLPSLQHLVKNDEKKRLEMKPFFTSIPDTQPALDSMLREANQIKVYSGQLINPDNGATLIMVSINKEILSTKNRDGVVGDVLMVAQLFEEETGIKLHYAGLPYIRFINTSKVKAELQLFLVLSIIVTGIILFFFFRSFQAVLFPLILIGTMIVWVMGTLSLFGYKITLLTGLIPPIIVVIGIPNCVYLLNKYHQEYALHGDKMMALSNMIRRIGIVTLMTNFTTAIGFLVLLIVDIVVLREFGTIAGINIMSTFIVSIVFIPTVFSYLPPPKKRHLKHLDMKPLAKLLYGIDLLVHRHKYKVFLFSIVLVGVSIFGMTRIRAVSHMIDDLPDDSPVRYDLAFFEENFSGVMPLELLIDTGNKKGVLNLNNLRKIDQLVNFLDSIPYISQPVSIVSFVKAARQAFYNENPAFYSLPTSRDQAFVLRYLQGEAGMSSGLASNFIDSTGQIVRVSVRIADVGSDKMDSLVTQVIEPKITDLFEGTKMSATITGTTLLFIKGNKFLIQNLISSMVLAFFVIAIVMGLLFRNLRMIIVSLIPNFIPLIITAGIMGYFGIPLKPSTALIFSIAFGISVDNSIHFLAKYRLELFANNFFVPVAVSKSIKEVGSSMIYTSIILFFGFVIFAFSEFGGTVALGTLTSTTLFFAMFTNTILLPSLLLRFDSGKRNKNEHLLIDSYSDFYTENDDEEIDIDRIKLEELNSKETQS
ncbi:MAG: efflux RND transporter permease subunit [Imperialibacter sp.]|uniref:efflux RND transporter permease subunit n=1 Tax=Imperialibacter sp. TaxID=2038411 RepID=UPI0030D819FF|tara:strand:+ start:1275 stop:3698 length:2424 start_codon:yes stop_codon:yes gene_type:complete